jgi:hypothetical protein
MHHRDQEIKTYLSEIAEKSPQEVAEKKKTPPYGIAEKPPREVAEKKKSP